MSGDDHKIHAQLYKSKARAVAKFISVKDSTDEACMKQVNEAGVRLANEIIKEGDIGTLLIPIEVDTNHPGRIYDSFRTYFVHVTILFHIFNTRNKIGHAEYAGMPGMPVYANAIW